MRAMVGSEDVILALASPPPPATSVILRIDGENSHRLFHKFLDEGRVSADPLPIRKPVEISLPWSRESIPVPAVAVAWAEGESWTGNESVELFFPGSEPILEGVMQMLLSKGARMATPGEFTRRAFMNGQIDLSSAESVLAVIEAEDQSALKAARRVLEGDLARQIQQISDRLVDVVAELEAGLDFSEQEVEPPGANELNRMLQPIESDLNHLLDRRHWPAQGPDLPRMLLWGKPNAGKSSLLNALAGESLAITSPEAGTTTDVIRGRLDGDGAILEILDLPGDRQAEGVVERLALERARDLLRGDDRILWVFDGRRGRTEWECERDQIPQEWAERILPVWTHSDHRGSDEAVPEGVIWISSVTSEGLKDLTLQLFRQIRQAPGRIRGDALRFTRRQRHLIEECLESLARCHESIPGPELLVADLREALHRLSEISGETTPEDVLDRIFARFCLGK